MAFSELAEQIRALQKKVGELFAAIVQLQRPAGALEAFAGDIVPAGWLLCDGTAVLRADYPQLFAAIGTTYGAGNGSTTFELPDARGRVLLGSGTGTASYASAHPLGQEGGAEKHVLSVDELAMHTHLERYNASTIAPGGGGAVGGMSSSGGTSPGILAQQSTETQGLSLPHNNMQPFLAVNYLIKT